MGPFGALVPLLMLFSCQTESGDGQKKSPYMSNIFMLVGVFSEGQNLLNSHRYSARSQTMSKRRKLKSCGH